MHLGWRLQAVAPHLHKWVALVSDRLGLVSADIPAVRCGPAFPASILNASVDVWRALQGAPIVEGPTLLAAAAAAGLVPRPGAGARFSRCVASGHVCGPNLAACGGD